MREGWQWKYFFEARKKDWNEQPGRPKRHAKRFTIKKNYLAKYAYGFSVSIAMGVYNGSYIWAVAATHGYYYW